MNEARNQILQRIRAALTRDEGESMPPPRLGRHPRGPLPAFDGAALDRFVAKVQAAAASCELIGALAEVPEAAEAYLIRQGLTPKLVAAPALVSEALPWPPTLKVEYRRAEALDACALTVAAAGIAETGTLALVSSAGTPSTLNYLPEFCLCVVKRSAIVTHMEDAWDLLCAERNHLPRAVHFITGPSRTADVEQTLQLGAHGPRQLHVIVVTD